VSPGPRTRAHRKGSATTSVESDHANTVPLGAQLASFFERPVAIVCVGNEMRGDDAFGIEVGRALAATDLGGDVAVIEGGSVPENALERAASTSPATVLFVDAADFGGDPGQVRVVPLEELGWRGASTHAASLELCGQYLATRCGARSALLAAQPRDTSLNGGLSPSVREAAAAAAEAIVSALGASG
jgi:hydrogenase 3 maturation protease